MAFLGSVGKFLSPGHLGSYLFPVASIGYVATKEVVHLGEGVLSHLTSPRAPGGIIAPGTSYSITNPGFSPYYNPPTGFQESIQQQPNQSSLPFDQGAMPWDYSTPSPAFSTPAPLILQPQVTQGSSGTPWEDFSGIVGLASALL